MSRTFRVWAPRVSDMQLVIGETRNAMTPAGVGWFACDVEAADVGMDYAFSLDGGDPVPDPRSRSQPAGVHGPSRLVEPDQPAAAQLWSGFPLHEAIVYELHVGTFTPEGTFDACIVRLDHLQTLGINAIELMPLAQYPGSRGWGYDGVDLFAPHTGYGGPDGLRRLVAACHERGIAVIVDVVYNHLGPEGDYLPDFAPYFTERYSTPWGTAFNYDGADSDDVRRFVVENAEMWLRDYGCDGLRLDAVHAIIDMSPTHILETISSRVAELALETGRHLWVIAESDSNNPRLVRDREVRRLRTARAMERRLPPCAAYAAHRGRVRILRGLRRPDGPVHRDPAGIRLRGTLLLASPAHCRPRHRRPPAQPFHRLLAEPRSGRQSRRW